MIATTAPFREMPMMMYHAADGISKSRLDLLHRSPAHYKHAQENPTPPTEAMILGSMIHKFILERDAFDSEYAVWPSGIDKRTKDGKAFAIEWEIANAGKIAVTEDQLLMLHSMRESINSASKARGLLTGGLVEQCMFWNMRGAHGDIACKARPDYINGNILVDLKSTTDARSDAFSKQCWNLRYHVQAAYYSDGYKALTDNKPDGFVFVAIEKTPPYAVVPYIADETMIEAGRKEYQRDLEVYEECLRTGVWPAYEDKVQALVLPRWTENYYGY